MNATAQDERALLDAAQSGDKAALLRLLEQHQAQIYRFGLKLCRDPEDAKDVLQETMLTVARALPGFRGQSSLSTWLYTIARSFCAKRRRRSKYAPEPETSWEDAKHQVERVADRAHTPYDALADKQLERAVQAAIDGLHPMYRDVIVLRDMEGLPAHEVAQVLGLTVEAVKSRLHRARKLVRDELLASPFARKSAAPSCPDIANLVELWSAHQENDISAEACARLEQHLTQCARCRGDCESLKRTLALCRTASADAAVPEHVQRAVRLAVRDFLHA